MGAPLHTDMEQGETEVVFPSISISQREFRDDRCVGGPPGLFFPRNTFLDIPGSAPVSAQTAPAYKQTAQASDSGRMQTAHPLTLYCIHNYTLFWEKMRFSSTSGCNVLGAGLGLVGPLYCLANLKVWLVKL